MKALEKLKLIKGTEELVTHLTLTLDVMNIIREGRIFTQPCMPAIFLNGKAMISEEEIVKLIYDSLRESKFEFAGDNDLCIHNIDYLHYESECDQYVKDMYLDFAGLGGRFRGIVLIRLDEWSDDYDSPVFAKLIKCIEETFKSSLIIFSVEKCRAEQRNDIFKKLSKFAFVKRVNFPDYSLDDVKMHILNTLSEYGFKDMPYEIEETVVSAINKEYESGKLKDIRQIDKLCNSLYFCLLVYACETPNQKTFLEMVDEYF